MDLYLTGGFEDLDTQPIYGIFYTLQEARDCLASQPIAQTKGWKAYGNHEGYDFYYDRPYGVYVWIKKFQIPDPKIISTQAKEIESLKLQLNVANAIQKLMIKSIQKLLHDNGI